MVNSVTLFFVQHDVSVGQEVSRQSKGMSLIHLLNMRDDYSQQEFYT